MPCETFASPAVPVPVCDSHEVLPVSVMKHDIMVGVDACCAAHHHNHHHHHHHHHQQAHEAHTAVCEHDHRGQHISPSALPLTMPPPPVKRIALPALAKHAEDAREAMRARLERTGNELIAPFDAHAFLPPHVLADRAHAAAELRAQLRLEYFLSPVEALDAVYDDTLDVAATHATAHLEGCAITVSLIRRTMCPLLHVDYVNQRAFCTLLGRGTEWLADPKAPEVEAIVSVIQKAMQHQDYTTANNLKEKLIMDPRVTFNSASERETVLIRGAKWPGFEAEAPLHRSPQLSHQDKFRLVVKVDGV